MSYQPNTFFEDAVIDPLGNVYRLDTPMTESAPVHVPRYPERVPKLIVKPEPMHFAMKNTTQPPALMVTQSKLLRIPPPAPRPVEWKNADVHAWSPTMRQLLKDEFPRLRDQSRLYAQKFEETVVEIKGYYGNDPLVVQVMDKMTARKKAIDVDLYGVMPAGLLSLVWIEYVQNINEQECYNFFKDTLIDMGGTCLQGDSHRLFTVLVSLHRAFNDIK